jgi:type I restriction enzyme S subunit
MNLLVLRPSIQSEPRWLYWLIRSPIFREVVESLAKPANNQASISQASINSIAVPVPEGSEQTAIATFLDRETAKIDGLVAEQRRLMELLKEKRQAVISHVVTKGLNPSAKMKPSGVEWLGDVPEHWEVRRLKHNLQLLTGKTDKRDNPVALENIEGWTGRFISTETEFQGEGVAFDAGDILFGKLRPYLAKAYRAESSGEAVGDFHVLRPVATINSRFAQYQILNREFIAIVDGSTFGSKMPRASWEFVGGMQVTAPPLAEQTAIAAFLDQETARFDTLTAEAQRAIDLLQERRTALISAAVTGQIDVRNMTTKETA